MSSSSHLNPDLLQSLRRMIRPKCRDAHDLEDILQEVLIKIHRQGGQVEAPKFLTWLHKVSKTTAIDFYRKNKTLARLSDQAEEFPSVSDADDREIPADLAQCIRPLLQNLEPDDKRVLSAIDLEGSRQTEVARSESIPYSSLKSRVQRARRKLKDEILKCCEIELDRRLRPVRMRSKRDTCC